MSTDTEIILASHNSREKVRELSNALLTAIAERLNHGDRLAFLKPNDDDSLDLTIIGIETSVSPGKPNGLEEERLFRVTKDNAESILATFDDVTLSSSVYRLQTQDLATPEGFDGKSNQTEVQIERDQIELITDLTAQKVEMMLNKITASRLSKLNDLDIFPETKYDVFLSYSSRDKDEARQVCSFLEKKGVTVFLAEKSIKPSSKWETTVRDALRNSRLLCLLATPNSLHSEWVITEWGAAWAFDIPILPLLFQCSANDLPERLRSYQALNYHEMSEIIALLKETKSKKAG